MTSGTNGKTASWVSAAVSTLVMLGAWATTYANISAKLSALEVEVINVKGKDIELDRYDAKLSEDIDDLSDRMIRSEAEQASIRHAQERIEYAINEMLKEMKRLNENMIRMGVKNGESGQDKDQEKED